jgi:flagellar hook-associated protein 2
MPAIQFGGLSSGLQTDQIISALMSAEKIGLTRLQTQHQLYDTRTAAYGKLGTALSDLLAKAKAFTVSGAGSSRSATSSDPSAFTATASTTAAAGQYRISVDRLATSTKATSTGSIGAALTDATGSGMLNTLPLAGSVTAGTVGIVVDGTIVHATIGNPATTSLNDALGALATAIQGQVQATDPGATVSASIVANQVRLTVAGAAGTHTVRFGAGGDTSNALTIFGLAGVSAGAFGTGTPIAGTTALGVVRTTGTLDAAGLSGLTSTTSGKLTINGVVIAYDTTKDSLNTVLSRINASNAGVTASMNRMTDTIVLTSKTAGAKVIDLTDTAGTLGAALKLAPGSTAAQVIGSTAQVTVDGTTYASDTNHVTTAIPGVALDLLDQGTGTKTLTVGVDRSSVRSSVKAFVDSFNALADLLDTQTAKPATSGAAGGALVGEAGISTLALTLRQTRTPNASGFTGSLSSLADLGVTTGAIGSAVGTTDRLALDDTKLQKALDLDPQRVADLLGGANGILKPIVDRLATLTGTNGMIDSRTKGLAASIALVSRQESDYQERLDLKQAALEAKFARLESTLSLLQAQSSQLAAQSNALNNG